MRVVVAPDKFKGSLEAADVVEHLAAGLRAVDPSVEVVAVPVADGGEGTLDAAVGAGFTACPATVTGPVGEPVETEYAVRGRTAVVEMAQASGLVALPTVGHGEPVPDAGGATSRGTGELVRAALDAGARTVVLGVGGSACTDGGAGLLQGLGARLLDDAGQELGRGGAALSRLARVDLSGLDPRVRGARFVLAADVDNPLTGPRGAAAVFGPQKGADPDTVERLDAALAVFRDRLAEALGPDVLEAAAAPGAGAAGGVGFAALAVLGAVRRPGIDVVLELTGLAGRVAGADLVVTGEGSLDEQSLGGKTPLGVAAAAHAAGVPVVAVCGRTTLAPEVLRGAGFARTWALADLEPDPRVSMREAGRLLEQVGADLAREMPGLVHGTTPAHPAPSTAGAPDQKDQ
ncbi:glycerate kinase [Kocuria flava]|uniref:Glycerate kinase n=1 Tax=Kocuria flava TaxID=446860 RepID=A0A0U3HUZ7_9MICC|nr:glycerate kinase [Kocuria flava]ALU39199.1 glycerate kinase [Kocuria flava]GEO92100.1 glycerate kinase [Kocuria flava]